MHIVIWYKKKLSLFRLIIIKYDISISYTMEQTNFVTCGILSRRECNGFGALIGWKVDCSSLIPRKLSITGISSILAFGFAFVIMLRCTSVTIFPFPSGFEETDTSHMPELLQEFPFGKLSLLFITILMLLIIFGRLDESSCKTI